MQKLVNKLFVLVFSINMEEASRPLSDYTSVEDVFTRELKPGRRNIQGSICSASDGTLARSEQAHANMAVQIKGLVYPLKDLLFGQGSPEPEQNLSWFYTVYLAPHNYHRVHSPVSGKIIKATYFQGEFWPVNLPFVSCVPNLFGRNERVVFEIEPDFGGRVYVVMVGALNVARIQLAHQPDFFTNEGFLTRAPNIQPSFSNKPIKIGDQLGTFLLGSTAVVVFDESAANKLAFKEKTEASAIMLGENLADLV